MYVQHTYITYPPPHTYVYLTHACTHVLRQKQSLFARRKLFLQSLMTCWICWTRKTLQNWQVCQDHIHIHALLHLITLFVTYHIAPNFWGTKFTQINLLQIFTEINFADWGFSLTPPIFDSCVHNLCSQLQQHHAQLLVYKSKCFCSGMDFVKGLLSFVHAIVRKCWITIVSRKLWKLSTLKIWCYKFTQMPSCILLASTFIQSCFQTFTPHFITVGW